jgi:hypothetical protein
LPRHCQIVHASVYHRSLVFGRGAWPNRHGTLSLAALQGDLGRDTRVGVADLEKKPDVNCPKLGGVQVCLSRSMYGKPCELLLLVVGVVRSSPSKDMGLVEHRASRPGLSLGEPLGVHADAVRETSRWRSEISQSTLRLGPGCGACGPVPNIQPSVGPDGPHIPFRTVPHPR